jgi:hypothetical protein
MEKKFFSRNKVRLVLVVAVSVFFISLAFSGTAPNPKKIYYLNIPAAAFTSVNEGDDLLNEDYVNEGSGIFLYDTNIQLSLLCPVYLPQGATVTNFSVFSYDASTTTDLHFIASLLSRPIQTLSPNGMATISYGVNGYASGMQYLNDDSISYATIENKDNQYYILIGMSYFGAHDNVYFNGCRIAYTL